MAVQTLLFFLVVSSVCGISWCSVKDYMEKRQHIIHEEDKLRIGGTMVLNKKETVVDSMLMNAKRNEIETSRINGTIFPPHISFFQAKKLIDRSPVYKFIKAMPKGGALHVHDSSITSLEWVIKNVTYRENCYMCYNSDGDLKFYFFSLPPASSDCKWVTVKSQRNASGNADHFDKMLIKKMSIVVDNPSQVYPTVNAVWQKFNKYFTSLHGLLHHAPVYRDYWRESLNQFRDDNVQYLEIRATLPETYELNGTTHDSEWALRTHREVANEFVAENPDFIGVKLIYSAIRFHDYKNILNEIKKSMYLFTKYPDFVKGFDLVGQEGPGRTLLYYLKDLLYPHEQTPPVKLPYFFHAGETDWDETRVDENLVDAILLNTSRIGHGYAMYKHPVLMKMIKEKIIPIEVNPISNQVLGLVTDLRNHAAVSLIAENYPIVISSDDPAVWYADPLSHDVYEAFMAMTGEDTNLTFLKQLAINSILFSSMDHQEKNAAIKKWIQKWNSFIDTTFTANQAVNNMDPFFPFFG